MSVSDFCVFTAFKALRLPRSGTHGPPPFPEDWGGPWEGGKPEYLPLFRMEGEAGWGTGLGKGKGIGREAGSPQCSAL